MEFWVTLKGRTQLLKQKTTIPMLKKALMVLGVVFLLVGVLGFFNNPILGYFHVNLLHNLVHLISGALALYFSTRSDSAAKQFSIVFGIVYLLVAVLGFVAPSLAMNLLAIDSADNYLHILLGLVFLVLGFTAKSQSSNMMA